MRAIAILPEGDHALPTTFHAVTTDRKAAGRTPGEALDALTSQLGDEQAGAAVIVQLFRPDNYFTAEQRERLSTLMERWRAARDAGSALPPAEQDELARLVDEELHGSAERAAQMSRELGTAGEPLGLRAAQEGAGSLATWERTTRRLWWTFVLYLSLLSILTVGLFLLGLRGDGRIEYPVITLIAVVVADIILHLLAVKPLLKRSAVSYPRDESAAPDASPEGSTDGGKRAAQMRAK